MVNVGVDCRRLVFREGFDFGKEKMGKNNRGERERKSENLKMGKNNRGERNQIRISNFKVFFNIGATSFCKGTLLRDLGCVALLN